MGTAKTAPGDASTQISLSGTKVRDLLRAGQLPPPEFSRPEVLQVLRRYYSMEAAAGGKSVQRNPQ